MKNVLLLLFVLPVFCMAQQLHELERTMPSVADIEKKAALSILQNKMQSLASGNFDVHYYRCEWKVDPAVRYINGIVTSTFTILSSSNSITFDLTGALTVDSVRYHGVNINFQRGASDALTIQFPSTLAANANDSVSIYYQGVPSSSGLGSFFQGTHAGVPVIWTLSEPYGAKDWWPCKNGLDDKADSIDIFITYPSGYVASSNGMLMNQQTSGGNIIDHYTHHHPIASYLVAFGVTNYEVRSDTIQANGKVYPFINYAYPERRDQFFTYHFYTKEVFRFFCEKLGDYPFERYGETQFDCSCGMEHQTNSFVYFTTRALTSHELAHQWFGDLVTCASWQDIWVNEGFAEYFSFYYLQSFYPTILGTPMLNNAANRIFAHPNGTIYVKDTTTADNIFYSVITYNKGMWVVHMLKWVLGDSAFFKGLQTYFNDPKLRFGYAKVGDMQRSMEQASGKNLTTFFQQWIYGEGFPSYSATYSLNNNLWAKVKLDQTTSHPASVNFYQMPVQLVFRNGQQSKTFVVDHKFKQQEFWLNVGFVPDTLMIDPNTWILTNKRTTVKEGPKSTKSDEILIYPNPSPADGNVVLRNPTGRIFSLQLINALGQSVFSKTIQTPGRDEQFTLPFSHLPRGAYWLRLRNDRDLQMVKKIIH